MFGYTDDFHCIIDNDFSCFHQDNNLLGNRKNSFVDLLTDRKNEPCIEDMQNIEVLFYEDKHKDLNIIRTETEQAQLLLDCFPDCNPINTLYSVAKFGKYYQKQLFSSRTIGTLTKNERKRKIDNYLAKKKNRIWTKRINYDCRKMVADKRLRFKGRFVKQGKANCLPIDLGNNNRN